MERQRATSAKRQRRTCSLRSTADLLSELEHALIDVRRSAGDKAQRAKAVVSIVAEARAILKAAELERENAELKALIAERMPELRRHLRGVP